MRPKLFLAPLVALLVVMWEPPSLRLAASNAVPSRHAAGFPADRLKDILSRTAGWVLQFADDAVYVVAEERYEQEYRTKEGTERRSLLSEVVVVRTPDEETRAGYPWVQFRDVIEVDGQPLPNHRGRLERLFADAGGSDYARASALIQESARFNIGPDIRTVNVPTFALFFLHPANQRRFGFNLVSDAPHAPAVNGPVGAEHAPANTSSSPVAVSYRERARPTMIRSPKHKDLPATGVFWIDPSTGRVTKTRLEVKIDRHWAMRTDVSYAYDAGIDAWVPQMMHEHFGDPTAAGQDSLVRGSLSEGALAGAESLDCTAAYSNYRRFRTSGRMIVK